jgi:hypothetical protein
MIPMFPNLTGTQNDQTVQTLLCVFWQTFNGLAPKLLTDGWGAKEPRKLLTDFLCYNCGIKEPELIASCALQFKE